MNFTAIPASATVPNGFTPDQQAAAWDAYISQDPYLSKHRGQYADRNAIFLPWLNRIDFSMAQGVFHGKSGRKHSGEVRLDITNFGNLLNSQLGRRSANHPDQHPHDPGGGCSREIDISDGAGQQRTADHVVPDHDVQLRRLHVDAELPVQLQLGSRQSMSLNR